LSYIIVYTRQPPRESDPVLFGHLAGAVVVGDDAAVVPEETGIYRGEVLTIMVALFDIRAELQQIRRLLEDENGEEEEEQEGDF